MRDFTESVAMEAVRILDLLCLALRGYSLSPLIPPHNAFGM